MRAKFVKKEQHTINEGVKMSTQYTVTDPFVCSYLRDYSCKTTEVFDKLSKISGYSALLKFGMFKSHI